MKDLQLPLEGVEVTLIGENGAALSIISRVTREMRKAGYSREVRDAYMKEAMSGNYDELLQTTMKWVEVY